MSGAPFKKGQWVINRDGWRPLLGKVSDIYDDPSEGWLMDVVAYNHKGERVGRISPPEGGPTKFEPSVPCDRYEAIDTPRFPLKLDIYSCWRAACKTTPTP